LNVESAVRFTGPLPNREALAEVAASGMFVLPSLGEGLGIVLIEAQALGVPAVGTRVGGIPDVIEDGVSGLLVPQKDPEAIAQAVIHLCKNPELARRLADGATSRLSRFDWDRIVERYAEIYEGNL
jgi:glycosyltransferase involved in cell wall biosynthesis